MQYILIRCTFRCTLWSLYPHPPPHSSPDLTGWGTYAIKKGAETPLNIKKQNSYSFIQTKAN
jgi:hypothetical protein